MNQDFIGSLNIRVRCTGSVPGNLEETARRFTSEVLEQACRSLDDLAPERMVFVRHLVLNWRLKDHQLAEPRGTDRCAKDIADRLESYAPVSLPISARDAREDVVVFADDAHWRAAHLYAQTTGESHAPWFFKTLAVEGDSIAALCKPGRREIAWQALAHLDRADLLEAMVESVPMEKLEALADALLPGESISSTSTADKSPASPLPEDLPPKVRSLILHAHARGITTAPPGTSAAGVPEALSRVDRKDTQSTQPHPAQSNDTAETTGFNPPPIEPGQHRKDAFTPEDLSLHPQDQQKQQKTQTVVSRAAGLFYLFNCALELNIGEILWKACLPESAVFAHAAALLLGNELADDPAVALFAGQPPNSSFPEVAADQQGEVSTALLAALVNALPRRGLAQYPRTILSLTEGRDSRLLVVQPCASPFILFAGPASSRKDITSSLARFLDIWPRSAPSPRASPLLSNMDDTARVIIERDGSGVSTPLIKPFVPVMPGALASQVAGVLGHLLEARFSCKFSPTARDFTASHLALNATVYLTAGDMKVVFEDDQINMGLRRAGLDRNPGWLPWLRRAVTFIYEGV